MVSEPKENLIYFFGDRVSFRSLYSPPGTLRHRISSPPPPPPVTFRPALLRPETSDSEVHEADLHAGGNPVGKQPHTRRLSPAACRPCIGACGRVGHFPVLRLHIQARPAPSCCSIPSTVHLEPSLSTFLPILPLPHSVSHLLHSLGLFFHLQFHSRDFKLHSRDSPSY